MSTTVGPSAYWYLTRSSGIVALVLLTGSVAVGVLDVARVGGPRWPRFVVDGVHRTVSLLAVVFLAVHILTAVLDSFAPISLVNALIPFTGTYRPLWLGFGALATDLLIAVTLTSIARRRLGHRAWRVTHWLAYACWPIAVIHGLGTGSDVTQAWLQWINAACVLVVLGAVAARAIVGWPEHVRVRLTALAVALAFAAALLIWLPSGPLGAHWARRAGTPSSLLSPSSTASSAPGSGVAQAVGGTRSA
ncbi:MAG TPA: ferric reductase-like transmembrane domain-containing protein [Solirubrobacteraceae bacterium]|nr:ferric reductase-like transmembrane domain-containing protein [Solirubrobacteraceae bacterium]